MRVPLTWLREYCDPDLDAAGIADRLDLTGTELERIEHVGVGDTSGFVVGKVLSAEQHPDADRLKVCEVDDGARAGARSSAARPTWPRARPWPWRCRARSCPTAPTLGEAKLRGVKSSGMICAEDELGIGEDHAGIMVLDDALPAGAPLAEHLPLADDVLELEITPNRPDCLSVYGMAREVHAATGRRAVRRPHRGRRHRLGRATPRPTTCRSRSPTPRSACASPAACSRT